MRRLSQRLAALVLPSVLVLLAGCESLSFYGQAARGQLQLLLARQPVARLLAEEELEPPLRQALERSQRLLKYLEDDIGLMSGRRYRSYVALQRDAVVYNLVATPQLSVTAHRWCYPVAGCVPYQGYFRRAAALRAAERYQARGFTTYVGRVPAYSTLGWFADPLLSTFINWPEPRLLNLLAHELAHSRLWLKGEAAFNEAFASFVGEQAVRDYYGAEGAAVYRAFQAQERAWRHLVALQLELRAALAALYGSEVPDEEKTARRDVLYDTFRRCYETDRERLGAGRFDTYIRLLNEAALAGLATYEQDQPLFALLFREADRDWARFFARVEGLNDLGDTARSERVAALRQRVSADQQVAQQADDERADQVQCRALAGHGVDRNPS
ncbi:MAG: aminopeptidase [Pseudomonadota bacterium]